MEQTIKKGAEIQRSQNFRKCLISPTQGQAFHEKKVTLNTPHSFKLKSKLPLSFPEVFSSFESGSHKMEEADVTVSYVYSPEV